MRYFPFVLLIISLSCSTTDKQHILSIRINSNAPENLISWYTSNLGLARSPVASEYIVQGESFQIELHETDAKKPEGRTFGFFKYGFTTNRIEELYTYMESNGSQFRGGIFMDENLKQRSFVSLDSEGNRVQFFEDENKPDLTPCFFSVITPDFENALEWYRDKMGFNDGINLDLAERNIRIRLMKNERWLLELLSLPGTGPVQDNQPGISSFGSIPPK